MELLHASPNNCPELFIGHFNLKRGAIPKIFQKFFFGFESQTFPAKKGNRLSISL